MASFISAAIFNAKKSDPKVDDSIVFYLLEYHLTGVPFRKKIMPVVDRLVTRFVACGDASQNMFNCVLFPRGFGAFEGRSSLMSG